VLGQADFTRTVANDDDQDGTGDETPSARTMYYPYMLACNGNQLVVADGYNHRVLIWNTFPTTDFAPADVVLGQSDFDFSAYNDDDQDGVEDETPSARTFYFVSGLLLHGRHLYVMDNGNNRVLVFEAQ